MTDTMSDERALELLREAVACSKFEWDKLVRNKALDHIAARLAQQAGEAVAYADPRSLLNFKEHGHEGGVFGREWMWAKPDIGLIPLYTTPQPLALPEVTAEDLNAARRAYSDFAIAAGHVAALEAAIESYRARLMGGAHG